MFLGAIMAAWGVVLLSHDYSPDNHDRFWGVVWLILGICFVIRDIRDDY